MEGYLSHFQRIFSILICLTPLIGYVDPIVGSSDIFVSRAKAKAHAIKKVNSFLQTNISAQVIKRYPWAVVGGGVAGILAIGMLIEHGVSPAEIAWIDKDFAVGALGKNYRNVPGNLNTQQWVNALEQCAYLKQCPNDPIAYLKQFNQETFYPLDIIVKPMEDITSWLLLHVQGYKKTLIDIHREAGDWDLRLADNTLVKAHKVILATGSYSRSLLYEGEMEEIPLSVALDMKKLAAAVKSDDTVAVVGSAHSAVIAMMFLSELSVKQVVHFYTHPFLYSQQTGAGVINVESGLKGYAAAFAKQVLEQGRMSNLITVFNDSRNREEWLPRCTKVIYAAGFNPTEIPSTPGIDMYRYNDTTGVLQKNLFGFGIAFPGKKADAEGKVERRVGVPHFIEYGKRVIPQWIAAR